MNEIQKKTAAKAVYFRELGLLRFLYTKGILTENEYLGIRRIAEEQTEEYLLCLN